MNNLNNKIPNDENFRVPCNEFWDRFFIFRIIFFFFNTWIEKRVYAKYFEYIGFVFIFLNYFKSIFYYKIYDIISDDNNFG